MKRATSLKLKFIAVLTALFSLISFQPANAVQFSTTMNSTCSVTSLGNTFSLAMPFNVPETATVTRIDWMQSSTTAPTDASITIKSDNAGAPTGSTLGTYSYSSMSGNAALFTGTASMTAAGRYWLVFRQVTTIYVCYSSSPVYTGSPSGWTLGTTYTWSSSDSGASYTSLNDYRGFLVTLYGTGGGVQPPASSITLGGPSNATDHQSITTTATLGIAGTNGKVTFFANGKRIPGCIGKLSSALSASCSWKPSRRGAVTVTASLTPTDTGYGSSTSAPKTILVSNRTNNR